MLEVVLAHLDKTTGGGQRALGDDVGGRHRRGDVQELVVDDLLTGLFALLADLEDRLFAGRADFDQGVGVAGIDALPRDHLPQGGGIGRNAKNARGGRGVDDLALGGDGRITLDGVVGQIGDLLGCPGALDRHRRAGEDRVAALEVLNALPGVGREILGVVAADAAFAQGVREALDGVPVELHAGGHHERVVADGLAAARADAVVLGSEARHGLADPGDASGDQAGLIAAGLLEAEDPATHQGPTRLVVVIA